MTRQIHGKIIGKTIELDEDPGIPNGQKVDVVVTIAPSQQTWGDGIKRSAGAAATIPDFNEVFEQVELDWQQATDRVAV